MNSPSRDSGQIGAVRLQFPKDIGERYVRLTEALIEAKKHALTDDADPLESVSIALAGVVEFIRSNPIAAALGLHVVLERLGLDIENLMNGGKPALLKPRPRRKGGPPPSQMETHFHGILAALSDYLNENRVQWLPAARRSNKPSSKSPGESDKLVAGAANRAGIDRILGGKITATRVKNWRYKLGVRAPKLAEMRANPIEESTYRLLLQRLVSEYPAPFESRRDAERFVQQRLAAIDLSSFLFQLRG